MNKLLVATEVSAKPGVLAAARSTRAELPVIYMPTDPFQVSVNKDYSRGVLPLNPDSYISP